MYVYTNLSQSSQKSDNDDSIKVTDTMGKERRSWGTVFLFLLKNNHHGLHQVQ